MRLWRMGSRGDKLIRLYRRLVKTQERICGQRFPFDRIDSSNLRAVVAENRGALAEIATWLPAGLLADSVFRYGINPVLEPLINSPVDSEVTHADLLAYFGRAAKKPCKYLELGVSVGKSLWQVMRTCTPCECWGFDIEEINPAIHEKLVLLSREEFSTPAASLKRTSSSVSRFVHPASTSTLTYICADILDANAWDVLSGHSFNVVLSDALHTPEALTFEWERLTKLNLLDRDEIIIVWDDLNGPMRTWFADNRPRIREHLGMGPTHVDTAYVNGWLGRGEFLHRLGIALKSDHRVLGK